MTLRFSGLGASYCPLYKDDCSKKNKVVFYCSEKRNITFRLWFNCLGYVSGYIFTLFLIVGFYSEQEFWGWNYHCVRTTELFFSDTAWYYNNINIMKHKKNIIWKTTRNDDDFIVFRVGASYSPVYDDVSNKINGVVFLKNRTEI